MASRAPGSRPWYPNPNPHPARHVLAVVVAGPGGGGAAEAPSAIYFSRFCTHDAVHTVLIPRRQSVAVLRVLTCDARSLGFSTGGCATHKPRALCHGDRRRETVRARRGTAAIPIDRRDGRATASPTCRAPSSLLEEARSEVRRGIYPAAERAGKGKSGRTAVRCVPGGRQLGRGGGTGRACASQTGWGNSCRTASIVFPRGVAAQFGRYRQALLARPDAICAPPAWAERACTAL